VFIFKVAAPLNGAVVAVDEPEPVEVVKLEEGVVIVVPYDKVEMEVGVVTVVPDEVDPEAVPVDEVEDEVEVVVALGLAPMLNEPVEA